MPIERRHDELFGMPSPEALDLASDVIRRRYILPETMQHPHVRSECLRLRVRDPGVTGSRSSPRGILDGLICRTMSRTRSVGRSEAVHDGGLLRFEPAPNWRNRPICH